MLVHMPYTIVLVKEVISLVHKLFAIVEFVYRFIALNVIWVIGVLLGLGVFGFMPATVSLFFIVRKLIKGETDIPLFSSFFQQYKAVFLKSNLIGAIFIPIFYVLYVNFEFVSYFYSNEIQFYIYVLIISVTVIVIMTFVNIFSVMANFNYSAFKYIRVAAGLVFLNPLRSGFQFIWIVAYAFIAIFYPNVIIVIGVSVLAYILMSNNYTIFNKYFLANG